MKFLLPAIILLSAGLSAGQAFAQAAILPGGAAPAPKAAPAPAQAASASAVAPAPVTPAANPNALRVKAEVNPVTGKLSVRTDVAGPTRVEITDVSGRPVLTHTMMNGTTPASLGVRQLPAGTYIVNCTAGDKTGMRRIMLGE